jgi:hypothetical protein
MDYKQKTRGVLMRRNTYEKSEIATFYVMYVGDLHSLTQQQTHPDFDGAKNPLIRFMHGTDNLIYLPFDKPSQLEKSFMPSVVFLPVVFQNLSDIFSQTCRAIAVPVSLLQIADEEIKFDETLMGSDNIADFVKLTLRIALWPIVTDQSQIEFAQRFSDSMGCPVLAYKTRVERPGWFNITPRMNGSYEIFSTTPSSHTDRSREL